MTSSIPRISIVTPSLNQARFLDETIDSVLSQGYSNLEYLVIDGGSEDGSIEIIKRYSRYLYYWVSEKDRGQTDAINKGLKLCTGDYWSFICSDDSYTPGAFRLCVEYFEDGLTDVLYGDCNLTNENGIVTRVKYPGDFARTRLLRGNFLFQPAMFLRRWILQQHGYFDACLQYAMDYEFWLRISESAQFTHVPHVLANYRLHAASKSMKATLGQNREGRLVKKKYGAGLEADWDYWRFRIVGHHLYAAKRKWFEILSHRK
jgi:glycosyltransferase involved in cell wall biosynthesis